MSDEDPTGYECVPHAEFVTRRLLAFMRNNQNHCNDEGCIEELQPPNNTDSNFEMTMMTLLLVFAAVMYAWRAAASYRAEKGHAQSEDRHDQSPPPPAPPAMR